MPEATWRRRFHSARSRRRCDRAASLSSRTLARRFERDVGTTPMRWVAAERIAAAKELLEVTNLTIDRISYEVGFGSPVTFRAAFTQEVGITPRRYRARFAAGSDAAASA